MQITNKIIPGGAIPYACEIREVDERIVIKDIKVDSIVTKVNKIVTVKNLDSWRKIIEEIKIVRIEKCRDNKVRLKYKQWCLEQQK